MQHSRTVHLDQSRQNASENRQRFLGRDLPHPLQLVPERLSVQILHHDVGGIIFLKAVKHVNNLLLRTKLRQLLGFLQEFLLAGHKLLMVFAAVDGDAGDSRHAGAELAGQIFLHRTADAQHLIVGEISDAESAGTQHPADNKPVLQSCTCRQLIGLVGGNAARCPAVGAGRSRIVICIKTAQT